MMGTFSWREEGIAFVVGDDRGLRCPYDNLLGVEVAGQEREPSEGARASGLTPGLEAVLVTHVLGRLMGRAPVNTLIGLIMRDGSLILHSSSKTTDQTKSELWPILGRLGGAGRGAPAGRDGSAHFRGR
jgi:hypothetical protein